MAGTKKIPQRQCIGCREMKNKKDLIRILKTDTEGIIIDVTGKKNGRGAYICPNADCFAKAVASKGLERSFKMPSRKNRKRRICNRKGSQDRESRTGYCCRRCIGKYKEDVYKYVCIL